ncbi:MAG: DUF1573 domain-containing protein [Bacteroidetes bacterium]|nr:DUF1573 domain-containing protein [Bacteroidota bacterium]
MKKIVAIATLVLVVLSFTQGFGQQPAQQNPTPATQQVQPIQTPAAPTHLKFENTTHDYGDIPQGIPATCEFTFTNVTSTPVSVTKVQKSCGCTEPKFSVEPVLPGKSSTITATYNAAGIGPFNKTLTVTTSENEMYTLVIKGKVLQKQ